MVAWSKRTDDIGDKQGIGGVISLSRYKEMRSTAQVEN